MKVRSYKELIIWQVGIKIVDLIYQITSNFPANELYGPTSQMRIAAISMPSNIAEGFTRNSTKEYIQFLYIALGSCAELNTQLIISEQRQYAERQTCGELFGLLNSEAKCQELS